jgi:hypothetical protein
MVTTSLRYGNAADLVTIFLRFDSDLRVLRKSFFGRSSAMP